MSRKIQAFSLLELSITLMVLGVIGVTALTVVTGKTNTGKQNQSSTEMDQIEDALMQYRTAKGRLPCPANPIDAHGTANFGAESGAMGVCDGLATDGAHIVAGVVPTKALALPDSAMYDAWGRRIVYAVDKRATADGAFITYAAHDKDIGTIVVNDASGSPRTENALYILLSHGKNGHGAYLKNGTRYNGNSSNADELKNCHCDSSAAASTFDNIFVSKSFTENAANANDSFDDLLRYKNRALMTSEAELQTEQSQAKSEAAPTVPLEPIELVLSHNAAPGLSLYSHTGGTDHFVKTTSTSQPDASPAWFGTARDIVFSHDNSLIAVGGYAGMHATGATLTLYNVNADNSITKVAPDLLAKAGTVNDVAFSSDSTYLAAGYEYTSAGDNLYYLTVFKKTAGAYTSHYTPSASPPGGEVKGVAWSPNDKYLATFAVGGTVNPVKIYKNTAGAFSVIAGQPAIQPSSGPYSSSSIKFSIDGAYLATTDYATPNGLVIYKVNDAADTFTKLSTGGADNAPNTNSPYGSSLTFSPNGKYLALGASGATKLTIFEKGAADAWTKVVGQPASQPPYAMVENIAFSADSQYLVTVGSGGGGPPYVQVYKVNSAANTFTLLSSPDGLNVVPTFLHAVAFRN